MNKRIDWIRYALDLAKVAATRSEDPFVKVGATILRADQSVASLGYNGVPPGIKIDWSNRDDRRKRVIHAEINALRYIIPNEGHILACPLSPCRHCIQSMASYGIKKVFYEEAYDKDEFAFELAKEYKMYLCKYTEGLYN